MHNSGLTAVIFASLFLTACQKKEATPEIDIPDAFPRKVFVPTADSTVSLDQLKTWIKCNAPLDSLFKAYADSFKTNDATHRIQLQKGFVSKQDSICKKQGLPGGYKEYTWILNHMGNPRNKQRLDSVGLFASH
ncbi:MAG: hypothetical protein GF398_17360 [Chitinivibrionales bacterium]|nr:hypothetical protein [Chitinivibrionales bacterium]